MAVRIRELISRTYVHPSLQTDFRNLPIPLLRLSLQTLVQKGKAQFLQGTEAKGGAGDDGDLSSGVKFA